MNCADVLRLISYNKPGLSCLKNAQPWPVSDCGKDLDYWSRRYPNTKAPLLKLEQHQVVVKAHNNHKKAQCLMMLKIKVSQKSI